MPYTVTCYALWPSLGEVSVTVHRVEEDLLSAYTGAPGMTLAAAQSVGREPRADGFRLACPAGRVVLDDVDDAGPA